MGRFDRRVNMAGKARLGFGIRAKLGRGSPFVGGAYIYIDPTPSKKISGTKSMFWTALRVCNPVALAHGGAAARRRGWHGAGHGIGAGHAPGRGWGGGMAARLAGAGVRLAYPKQPASLDIWGTVGEVVPPTGLSSTVFRPDKAGQSR